MEGISEEVNRCMPVQELIQKDEKEVPDSYISRDTSVYGHIDSKVPLVNEIPVIDFSKLVSSSGESMDAELEKLRSALSSWGYFQLINHGMQSSFLDEIREVSRQFFNLPMEEKQKYSRPVGGIEGYGNDMVLFKDQQLDWVDRLYLLVTPLEQQKLQYWPQNPQSFRNVLHEYTARIGEIQDKLLKSIAKSTNIPEDCFLNQLGKRPEVYVRFNYYPRCSRPDLVNGLKPHADGSVITILLQDKHVEGLQVHRHNQWFRVPNVPYALLVNLGDQLEIMSNGIFKSPMHRALTNSKTERITVAMFSFPDPEYEIGPVDQLVDAQRPRLFKNITNYLGNFFQNYQQGKRRIDTLRVLCD